MSNVGLFNQENKSTIHIRQIELKMKMVIKHKKSYLEMEKSIIHREDICKIPLCSNKSKGKIN